MFACVCVGLNLGISQLLDQPAQVVQALEQLGLRLLGHRRQVDPVVVQAVLAHLAEQDALAALLACGAARQAAYPRALASVLVVALQVSQSWASSASGPAWAARCGVASAA